MSERLNTINDFDDNCYSKVRGREAIEKRMITGSGLIGRGRSQTSCITVVDALGTISRMKGV